MNQLYIDRMVHCDHTLTLTVLTPHRKILEEEILALSWVTGCIRVFSNARLCEGRRALVLSGAKEMARCLTYTITVSV